MKKTKLLYIIIAFIFISYFFVNYKTPDYIKTFDTKAALEDYEQAFTIIESSYPYIDAAQRLYDIDVLEIKDFYYNKIQNTKSITLKEFNEILTDCINEFNYLGHISVMDANFYYYAKNNLSNTQGFEYHYSMLNNPNSDETYQYLNRFSLINNLFKTTESINEYNENNMTLSLIDNTIVVTISAFNPNYIDKDLEKLELFIIENSDIENLVIDLTHNSGGSDYYWMQVLVQPFIKEDLTSNNRFLLLKSSTYTQDLISILETQEISKKEIELLPNINLNDIKGLELAYTIPGITVSPSDDYIDIENIYLLINENVMSSGDIFASFCKDTKFATLIGQPTSGNGPSINPYYFPLNNSGLILTFQIDYTTDSTGALNSEVGTLPDIYSQNNEKPLNTYKREVIPYFENIQTEFYKSFQEE